MLVRCTETTQIIQIEQIIILTRDTKQIMCQTITVHLDTSNHPATEELDANELTQIVRWWFHWMGHIYFSRDLFTAKASYEGAIRLAINKELHNSKITCTRLHIQEIKLMN